MNQMQPDFSAQEAHSLFARLVHGQARAVDVHGIRCHLDGLTVPGGFGFHAPDRNGSYEGVTRMMYGWAGWLSKRDRNPNIAFREATVDISALMRTALIQGCDPTHPGYWGDAPVGKPGEYDQRTVEAGHTMFCAFQARDQVWDKLSPLQQDLVANYHERFSVRPTHWTNNWALFWALNHCSRAALAQAHDVDLINDVLHNYLDRVYCGDGWYDDSATRGAQQFDDYGLWVYGSHVCMCLHALAGVPGVITPERRAELLNRVRALMQHVPAMFAENGAYPNYGRSLIYKFARLGSMIWAYRLGAWPHAIGVLKRIVGRHLGWHIERGGIAADGSLIQPLTAQGSREVRDPYNAAGSQYWAMQCFGALWQLPDDDPFWTTPEDSLPVERADSVAVHAVPGWVISTDHASGHVQRFVAGSTHRPPSEMPAKYDKLVYATAAPFNAGYVLGQPSPDGALCLSNGALWAHRCGNQAFAVGAFADGERARAWLRMRYALTLGRAIHWVDTTVLVFGVVHIRAHRITLDPAFASGITACEGAAALGYPPGIIPQLGLDAASLSAAGWVQAGQERSRAGRKVAIRAIHGYDRVTLQDQWLGRADLNSEYAHMLMPLLHVAALQPQHTLACAVHIGPVEARSSATLIDAVCAVTWDETDGLNVLFDDGASLHVAPLKENA